MPHNKIYLIYTAILFLIGVGFYIFGEFNRGEKPDLPDPNMIGKDNEEETAENTTEPGVSEISADQVEMPVPEPESNTLEDISLDEEETGEEPESEGEAEEEEEEVEPPIYDGHEEERIQMIKDNYVIQERYDSLKWMSYIAFVFWVMAAICGILYILS